MDMQEFLDQGVCHVFRQGKPGVHISDNGSLYCQYRARGGERCFIGGLIPDAVYTPSFEKIGLSEVLRRTGICADSEARFDFAVACQRAHDEAASANHENGVAFLPEFARNSARVADSFGLNTFALRGCLAALSGAL